MSYPWSNYKTWVSGEILTAADLNNSLSNIIDHTIPEDIDDYSANTTEMQTTTDPYPAASPSLATTLSGELERVRYMVKQITGESQWYIDAATDLTTIKNGTLTIAGAKTFSSAITVTPTTNQLVLGTTRTVTLTAPTPASSSRTVTIPDLSADYSVVGTAGTQTIGGAKTFTSSLVASAANHAFGVSAALGNIGVRFTNSFTSPGGLGGFVAGLDIDPTLTGGTGDTAYQVYVNIAGFGITTQASETVGVVASLQVKDPQITVGAGGSVDVAALIYTDVAPTQGTVNAAIYVNSGVILTPAGSVGSPVLSTKADRDTGLYYPADDSVALSGGGTKLFQVDSSSAYFRDGAANTPAVTFISDSDNGMFLAAANAVGFATLGNERMRITSGGNVAIAATARIYLDGVTGAGDTYLVEAAGNTFNLVAGGTAILEATSTDLYTTAWTDYFASSTVTGWGTPSGKIMYKKIGKITFVQFQITGTSNATGVTFTLPTANSSNLAVYSSNVVAQDNGTDQSASAVVELPASSSTVTVYKNWSSTGWTNSGAKQVYGQFWYQSA